MTIQVSQHFGKRHANITYYSYGSNHLGSSLVSNASIVPIGSTVASHRWHLK
jgi:polysaccharide deacetylase 2 family uncharacterized protein YibQ